jgi:hypothetical protein
MRTAHADSVSCYQGQFNNNVNKAVTRYVTIQDLALEVNLNGAALASPLVAAPDADGLMMAGELTMMTDRTESVSTHETRQAGRLRQMNPSRCCRTIF